MTDILVVTRGDRINGLGHVSRQMVLADALRQRGVGVEFVTEPDTPGWDVLNAGGYRVYKNVTTYGNLPRIMIDLEHGPTREQLVSFRAASSRLIVVCGNGFSLQDPPAVNEYADLKVYQGLDGENEPRTIGGVRHVIIRPDFADCVPDPAGPVLVCMGGADPHGLTLPALQALAGCGRPVRAFLGAAAELPPRRVPWNAQIIRGETNLAPFFHGASLFVGAFGTVAWEALAAGVPCILYGWSDGHVQTAAKLAQMGVALNYGRWDEFNSKMLGLGVRIMLTEEQGYLEQASAKAKALVDAQGAGRVAEAIVELLR